MKSILQEANIFSILTIMRHLKVDLVEISYIFLKVDLLSEILSFLNYRNS